ncbi:MAG: hypothetical protein Q9202_004722 [Teloschistes flavicans]
MLQHWTRISAPSSNESRERRLPDTGGISGGNTKTADDAAITTAGQTRWLETGSQGITKTGRMRMFNHRSLVRPACSTRAKMKERHIHPHLADQEEYKDEADLVREEDGGVGKDVWKTFENVERIVSWWRVEDCGEDG